MTRIGIFGGSFDPVHYGHLRPAAAVATAIPLDRVIFVPANRAPGKETVPPAPAPHRVAMLALALEGRRDFTISLAELERGGTSYTVDTLRGFRRQFPDDELYFLLGTDALAGFDRWRDPEEILRLATLAAFVREPHEADVAEKSALLSAHRGSILIFDAVRVKISSTDVRCAAAAGEPLSGRTPPAVEEYIAKHRIYRDSGIGRA